MDDWGRSRTRGSSPVMWMRGGAGAGKSTLAQTIAMMYKREALLVGEFLFSNRRPNRSDGKALILTLVLQLIIVSPDIGPLVFDEIKKNPMILSSSPEEHIQRLFIGPLNTLNITKSRPFRQHLIQLLYILIFLLQLIAGPIFGNFYAGFNTFRAPSTIPKPQPTLIIIDGLDECDDAALQTRLIRIIGSALPQLCQPLRFLISSRPEAHIVREGFRFF
ncbi:hypothetical protein CPB83DRAFT_386698 [Crepidotus variabilis]|uniref:Nephrocystin 3-like N-terminal domain-containing protein n=1 Tax=Crepidotus variabilis TaxID=179855 RepID=A0A9P6JPH0_9AGAR|nr:hypothetical protein CPB83DRAFT_386698 [Crepidotus variabilis]